MHHVCDGDRRHFSSIHRDHVCDGDHFSSIHGDQFHDAYAYSVGVAGVGVLQMSPY